ncbi:hypothetical protein SMACR_09617 [Sordaria macrospora]|uniref:WGS project CABT00000000 data, contig 2.128 n=2 Tax=Sordaria macrospora TaxID=5147 RepID=F7WCF8_SORMK|nr:uncharacterized protein SMAC_09617 [Sordaria macrospora k-hell]KAA8630222.1 hypothetical protein SMACR_09617 [Sordaria macrospora]WPJ59644.1 hypothetical protein SMAC4_09617 [Sordaria macrospora]CCC14590.1 unnamed protein product [Sordaria macrospora k-hell]
MDYLGPAVLLESQHYDQGLILLTAMRKAISTKNIGFLSTMLEYPSLRQLVNVVIPGGSHGARSTLVQQASLCASSRSGEFRDITGMDTILSALVRKGGASLGPYPAGHGNEGMSPLLEALRRDQYETAENLLRLGCDPDGKYGFTGSQTTQTALQWLIYHERAYRRENPEWVNGGFGYHRNPSYRDRLPLFARRERAKETIKTFLCHGASPMLKGGKLNSTPLEHAISHGVPFLPLTHPVAAYKLLKLFLKHIKNAKITAAARKRTKTCMDRISTDLRAERGVFTLSDWRVRARLRLAGHLIHHEKRDGPILLFWKGWSHGANGGRLVRSRD